MDCFLFLFQTGYQAKRSTQGAFGGSGSSQLVQDPLGLSILNFFNGTPK